MAVAERMEREAIAAQRFASGSHAGLSGRVVVTASEWLVARAVAPLMTDFSNDYPGIEVELLAEAKHLSLSESLSRIPEATWLPQVTRLARVASRANGRLPMLSLADSGAGFACLPHFLSGVSPRLHCLPIDTDHLTRDLYLGVHRDVTRIPRVRETLTFLTQSLRGLASAFAPR